MGIWDLISWSTDSVKGLLHSSYDHGSAAITKSKEVSVDALEKVNHHLSDPQTRSKISRVATDVAKNATVEGLKFIPGAYPTYKIVSKSIDDDDKKLKTENTSKKQEENLKSLLATVSKLEKEVDVLRQQSAKQAVETKPCNTVDASRKPEGKNPAHSMKEFIRSHF